MHTVFMGGVHPLRPQVQDLVGAVYARVYGAQPPELPEIVAARCHASGRPLAACGLRTREDGFFSTVYLDGPLGGVLTGALGRPVDESEVVEVTSLASLAARMALPLIRDVVAVYRARGMTCGLFTTTDAFAAALRRDGLPLVRVAPADPRRIADARRWGSYYEAHPFVYAVDDVVWERSARRIYERDSLAAAGAAMHV